MSVAFPETPAEALIERRRYLPRAGGALAPRIAAGYLIVLAVLAIVAPLIALHDPNAIHPLESFRDPTLGHLLGQDQSGRDILSRLLYGARLSLLGPAGVVLLSVLIGIPMGLLAGWRSGAVDSVVSRTFDAVLAFPPLLLAIIITAAFGAGFKTAILAIAITYVPLMGRVTRGLVLAERQNAYVDAFRCQGFSSTRVAALHVLPNCSRPLVAQATLNFGYALIDLAALSFLGLGVQPPTADWGSMLAEGRQSILIDPFLVIAVSIAICSTVVAFNVLGNSMASRSERRR